MTKGTNHEVASVTGSGIRRVVAPSADYRHFADRRALLDAVCSAALAELAGAMEAELAGLPRDGEPNGEPNGDPDGDPAGARARFGAVGRGYLRFAREEPGLFRMAFSATENLGDTTSPAKAGRAGCRPSSSAAPPWTGSWKRGCCRPSVARARSSWPGRRSTASGCSSSTAPCAGSMRPRG
jgi:hypothetical protein